MNTKRGRKKEGFLQVKLSSRSALGKAWKRKWVVVQQNTTSTGKSLLLELYLEKGAYHKTVTSLLLEGVVKVQRTSSKTQGHAIEISSDSKVLLAVSADSEAETQDWLNMFRINLLPPVKELPCPPGIPEDFMRVSVIPSKDSERLKLVGDYFAHISLASINLYDTQTGKVALEWDLRHLKKFMLISKCHQQDAEKIVHILPSKRSPHGAGEFIFFSAKGKQLVEGIYERLSNAMTVKSRRSRSTSMLFEITPQELEQMFNDAEQPPEEALKETEEEEQEKEQQEKEVREVKGDATEKEVASEKEEIEANGVKGDSKTKEIEPASKGKEEAETKEDEVKADEARQEENIDRPEDTTEQVADAKPDVPIQNGEVEVSPPSPRLEEVSQELGGASVASETQDAVVENSVDETEKNGSTDEVEHEDDKANQTNPEEMDEILAAEPPSDTSIQEQVKTDAEVAVSSQDDTPVEDAIETTKVEQVESQPVEEGTPEVPSSETRVTEENAPVSNDSQGDDILEEAPAPGSGNASDAKIEESPSSGLETEPDASSSPQEVPESKKEDAENMVNTEPESGLKEGESGAENPDLQKDTVNAEVENPLMQSASDLQETTDQSIDTKDSLPEASAEDVPAQQDQTEVVDAAEPVEDNATSGLDQGATDEVSETSHDAQPQDKQDDEQPMDITPDSTPKATLDSSEPIQNPVEEETKKEPVDGPNPNNNNNSNANLPSRPNSTTAVPVPNILTSRMAEAMRNAQKQKTSTEASPSQKTQTDFPPDREGTDHSSEVIV